MKLNSDFTKKVVIHGDRLPWQPSPMTGVERRMLERIGDETARATSIVSYAPNSNFSSHVHYGGEEFLVLEGVFQDEQGDYPVGSYVRNPPQSSHTPGSKEGCVIFVKLWQFAPSDRTEVKVKIQDLAAVADPHRRGISIKPLFQDQREEVRIEEWQPNLEVVIDTPNGGELLVLEGSFTEGQDEFQPLSWLRLPVNSKAIANTGTNGAKVWIKTGHLPFVAAPFD
jgi:anti-sigma factor ChrR (cupin superfamily)